MKPINTSGSALLLLLGLLVSGCTHGEATFTVGEFVSQANAMGFQVVAVDPTTAQPLPHAPADWTHYRVQPGEFQVRFRIAATPDEARAQEKENNAELDMVMRRVKKEGPLDRLAMTVDKAFARGNVVLLVKTGDVVWTEPAQEFIALFKKFLPEK